ncbi:MAG: 4Fe-4S binding protein [Coriobacteriia bacterium]|nr:4Fe-4S binding protein [Coriobacteriia bacterium]
MLTVLATSTVIGLLHQKARHLGVVGVDALCPFGGIESLWALLSAGVFIKRIAWGSVVLLGGAVALNLAVGRAFCGQFCPLGTLQEIFGSLRGRIGVRRREVPAGLDIPARMLKYAVFGIFTWLSWLFGTLVIRPYDPWAAYHHLTSPELFTEFGIGAAVLGVSLAGSFVYDRFFCKYLCPMGAFLALFSRLSWFRVTRVSGACVDCGACDKVCPVNIEVSGVESVVSDSECIACALCVDACPKAEALEIRGRRGGALSPLALVGLTAAVMLGIVAVTTALGLMGFTTK